MDKGIHETKSQRYKIMFVFDSRFAEWKGTQRFFYEFGSYLVEKGCRVELIENNIGFNESPIPLNIDIPFDIISFKFHKIFSIYHLPKKIIQKYDPDVIYVNSFTTFPLIPMSNFRTIYGMHIIHVSSLKYMKRIERLKFNIKRALFILIVRLFWRKKDVAIHALNTEQLDWINGVTKNRFPVWVIGNPVECQIDQNIEHIRNMGKNEKFTILFFGSLSWMKGFSEFLRILDFVEQTGVNEKISFIIAGDGTLIKEAILRTEKFENVKFVRRPDDSKKREIMLNADLFVFPSMFENSSITAVEAQASGLPCLFSDITPLRNLLIYGKTGYSIPLEGDFEKRYFEKIEQYLDLWLTDYDKYRNLRMDISGATKRLCKENVLPKLLDMVESFINDRDRRED